VILGVAARLAIAVLAAPPVSALPAQPGETHGSETINRLFYDVSVFSDDPNTLHDPRHPQVQTGEVKRFAPIGLIWTNHGVPHQYGPRTRMLLDMSTGFLVSPCYVMTAYHAVFGNEYVEPPPDRDYSMTFSTVGMEARVVPVMHGDFAASDGQDWALLQFESDAGHPCLGENPKVGWLRLAPLSPEEAVRKPLSTAGYPSDKSASVLWRQDVCHLFQPLTGKEEAGLWTTDCATLPRASGEPIFYAQDGVLNVVALMHGHLGSESPAILPHWDPNQANLAVGIAEILSAHPDLLTQINADIARFRKPNPAQDQPDRDGIPARKR
jgi:hypothetical protein